MATIFVMHAITLVIGAVVVVVVVAVALLVVVIVAAVNHCPAFHSRPYCQLTDFKPSHIFKIILSTFATIFQAKFLK
jgi:hypothetical protein